MKDWRAWAFLVVTALALSVAAQSVKFTTGNPAHYAPEFKDKYMAHLGVIRAHGIAAIMLLALGPFQFIDSLRKRFPKAHRISGRIYFFGILIASISGFRMGLMAHGGALAEIAFCAFAVMWLLTAVVALRLIFRGDVKRHREWMIRNFALTFGAVTLRVYLNVLQWFGADFDAIYVACAWLGWIPNIVAAELIIARKWRKMFASNPGTAVAASQ